MMLVCNREDFYRVQQRTMAPVPWAVHSKTPGTAPAEWINGKHRVKNWFGPGNWLPGCLCPPKALQSAALFRAFIFDSAFQSFYTNTSGRTLSAEADQLVPNYPKTAVC